MSFLAFQILMASVLGLLVLMPLALGWRFLTRRGRSGWAVLLLAVPVLNLVAVYSLAFRRAVAPRPLSGSPGSMHGALPNR
ncbi:DUF805 domain-containing protein [Arenibaculum pallidiluteum]|uniref:hypothetical protein n=1 Tax=Arenibaculum pallidiluteum TaxID=2812559 RepID=UPI001A976AAF|nr:hypothetical protein [Arenibaculum pallidiluteum]